MHCAIIIITCVTQITCTAAGALDRVADYFLNSMYEKLLYEALQDQSITVPLTVHMAQWYI